MNAQALDEELLKLSLSPIAGLLDDPELTDIMVRDSQHVFARGRGRGLHRTGASWLSDVDLMTAAKTIGRQMGRRLDHEEPILDARLPDGSRVNIVVEPCYHRGAFIAIRRFPKERLTWEHLERFGSIDRRGVRIIESLVGLGKNILISGGAGCGKTTLLNCLCSLIRDGDIVVTVEDAREISLPNELWVPLETKHSLRSDDREVTLRHLVRNSLRMNPRWIIVGEVRGDEALDLVRALNTGHCGASSIHANSCRDALLAMESLILFSGLDAPAEAIRELVSRAIQIVIHVKELPDYSRKVAEIAEVEGLDYRRSSDLPAYKLRSLYRFQFSHYDEQEKVCGEFVMGQVPSWLGELKLMPRFSMPDFWTEERRSDHATATVCSKGTLEGEASGL